MTSGSGANKQHNISPYIKYTKQTNSNYGYQDIMTSRKSQFRIHKEASRCRDTSRIHGPIYHSLGALKKRPETRKARQMPPSFPALTCNYKDNNVFTSARRFYLFAFWFITVCRAPDTWYRSFAERGSLKRVTIIFSSVSYNECMNSNEGGICFYLPSFTARMFEQIKSFSFDPECATPTSAIWRAIIEKTGIVPTIDQNKRI